MYDLCMSITNQQFISAYYTKLYIYKWGNVTYINCIIQKVKLSCLQWWISLGRVGS